MFDPLPMDASMPVDERPVQIRASAFWRRFAPDEQEAITKIPALAAFMFGVLAEGEIDFIGAPTLAAIHKARSLGVLTPERAVEMLTP